MAAEGRSRHFGAVDRPLDPPAIDEAPAESMADWADVGRSTLAGLRAGFSPEARKVEDASGTMERTW